MRSRTVFTGEHAVLDYLNPENNPPTPLVELPPSLNQLYGKRVRIFCKLMSTLPLGNVKSLPALNMLHQASANGDLKDVKYLVESSSGNTVISLTVLARLFGIPNTKAFVSNEVTKGKLDLLRFFGTEIEVGIEPICPDPKDKNSGIERAKREGGQHDAFNPGQYHNSANPGAHERWTGPQIWEQTEGDISVFCAGLGTSGTLTGTSNFLRTRSAELKVIGVTRMPNNPVPGVRTNALLSEVAFPWEEALTHKVRIGTKESFEASLRLCRVGLLVGPSAGFAYAGLMRTLEEWDTLGSLDSARNENGEVVAVFIAPDLPYPYMDDYFEYLPSSHFGAIKNEHLLRTESEGPDTDQLDLDSELFELSPSEAHKLLFEESVEESWQLLRQGVYATLRPNVVAIDVRSKSEYDDHHVVKAVHVELSTMQLLAKRPPESLHDTKVVIICALGAKTLNIVAELRRFGIEAYSLRGGDVEWGKQDLPRWRAAGCALLGGKS